jgi:hypothetical protein
MTSLEFQTKIALKFKLWCIILDYCIQNGVIHLIQQMCPTKKKNNKLGSQNEQKKYKNPVRILTELNIMVVSSHLDSLCNWHGEIEDLDTDQLVRETWTTSTPPHRTHCTM